MMGNESYVTSRDFVDALRRYTVELLGEVFAPVRTADERFLEIDRVVHDADDGEDVAVPHDVLGDRGAIARRNAVALDPSGFDVRRLDGEHGAFPVSRRESSPRVRGVLGRMR